MIRKYYNKEKIIEAVQWTGDNLDEIKTMVGDRKQLKIRENNKLFFELYKGCIQYIDIGDYIIRHSNGDLERDSSFIFEKYHTKLYASDELPKDIIENVNPKSVEIYYQQAIEAFNFLLKKNESIKSKANLLFVFLCSVVCFCIACFTLNQQNYRYAFLVTAILYYCLSLFVCFKLFLTKASTSPYYPVQKQDDQKAIYQSSPNDILTTIINANTKPAIENAKEINDKLLNNFNFAVKLIIFVPLISVVIFSIASFCISLT